LNIVFRAAALMSVVVIAFTPIACGQAVPTATQPLQVDVFGAVTGTWTGLSGGRNLGITAGLDVGWKPFHGFYPALELRGTYPIYDGQVAAEKNVLYGFRASRFYGPIHPYANFLIGRDKIDYQSGGYANASDTLLYINSVSNVFSYGGGADVHVTDHFDLKLDGQLQQYGVPVNASGHIYSKALSIGVVYHLDFNHHIHYGADGQEKSHRASAPPRSTPQPPGPGTPSPDPPTAPSSSSQPQ
jgi:hypothetical protein